MSSGVGSWIRERRSSHRTSLPQYVLEGFWGNTLEEMGETRGQELLSCYLPSLLNLLEGEKGKIRCEGWCWRRGGWGNNQEETPERTLYLGQRRT